MEGEREERVGVKAVLRERMVWEGVRRGAKEVEKRLVRVDIFGCLGCWLVLGVRSLLRVSRGESERESERSGQIQLSIVESKVGWFRGGEWVVRLTWKECYNDVVGNVRALFRVGLLVAQV